jgi:hypothetical protein
VEVQLHVFLTSALDGGECSASRSGWITPGWRTCGTHRIGCWWASRAGLDAVAESRITVPAENRVLIVQPVTGSLYWLNYPDFCRWKDHFMDISCLYWQFILLLIWKHHWGHAVLCKRTLCSLSVYRNISRQAVFYGDELLAIRPILKPEDHPLSAVRYCLFHIFAATLHIWRLSSRSATPWWQGPT